MDPEPQEIEVSATLLENSCGLALDVGYSLAKIVYRCNKSYKDGKLIDKAKRSPDMGHLKMVAFPRDAVDIYLQYIADHADLTGDPPQVNSCGYGAVDHKEAIEKKLKVKLNILSELRCLGSFLARIIKDSALTTSYHDLDEQGVEEGKTDSLRYIHIQYKLCDEQPLPEQSHFDEAISDAVESVRGMMMQDIRLPCLVALCGSAFMLMVLDENGRFDYRDVTYLGGRSLQGLASLLTGEKDWTNIEKMFNTHDGSTAYNYRTAGPQHAPPTFKGAESQGAGLDLTQHLQAAETTEKGEDIYNSTMRKRFFPFGNADIVPRETIKDGDLLYALFDTVSTNIGTLAYNTALAQDLHQVIFCGSFINNPLARTLITKAIMWRNIHAYYKKSLNKLVDFRFVMNGGHLGAIGALVNTDNE